MAGSNDTSHCTRDCSSSEDHLVKPSNTRATWSVQETSLHRTTVELFLWTDSWLHVNDKMEDRDKFAFSLRQAIIVPISVAWIDFISVVPMQYIPQLKSSPKHWKKMKSILEELKRTFNIHGLLQEEIP
ncbi:hypothetical protein IW261DRAFT_1412840 [Armillaria novae-zelandiae]|uniref:Uncharacterized protein n=1 Tax=Armillaria novae-zelandiae TaxID=153914 RepID=A0AA39PTI4_9AGAR|nr:hypothetical protein IW261DRAFT_1412840 [Armillaria novae-zelandiae]